mmetsp:Transcript_16401/g.36196  ORF Transcript_16401/g.36196 Transcript_16401/m.36196 type:complete len:201 (+) Transcript_16401:162-764(+)
MFPTATSTGSGVQWPGGSRPAPRSSRFAWIVGISSALPLVSRDVTPPRSWSILSLSTSATLRRTSAAAQFNTENAAPVSRTPFTQASFPGTQTFTPRRRAGSGAVVKQIMFSITAVFSPSSASYRRTSVPKSTANLSKNSMPSIPSIVAPLPILLWKKSITNGLKGPIWIRENSTFSSTTFGVFRSFSATNLPSSSSPSC